MKTLRQLIRFVANPILGMIVKRILIIMSLIRRFESVHVAGWEFHGPKEFIKLIEDARDILEKTEPELLVEMKTRVAVFFFEDVPYCFPWWGIGTISKSSILLRVEGVIAAWLFIHYQVSDVRRQSWWVRGSFHPSAVAKAKTKDWLQRHDYAPELWEMY